MSIVWEYVETYHHDEPIVCPGCDNHISTGKETTKGVELVTCGRCEQELRIQNKTYQVHEVYAKKEVEHGKNRTEEARAKE